MRSARYRASVQSWRDAHACFCHRRDRLHRIGRRRGTDRRGPSGARPRPLGRAAPTSLGHWAPRCIAARSRISIACERRGAAGRRDPPRLHPRLLEIRRELRHRQARHRGDGRGARRLRQAPDRHLRHAPAPGRLATEEDAPPPERRDPRVSEAAGARLRRARRARHGDPPAADGARRATTASSRCLVAHRAGEGRRRLCRRGRNRWPAVHRLDAARLYRLALEKGVAGASYHAVADEGVPIRDIAEVIGRRLGAAGRQHAARRRRPSISAGSRCSPATTARRRAR